jgi:hypothetical protein
MLRPPHAAPCRGARDAARPVAELEWRLVGMVFGLWLWRGLRWVGDFCAPSGRGTLRGFVSRGIAVLIPGLCSWPPLGAREADPTGIGRNAWGSGLPLGAPGTGRTGRETSAAAWGVPLGDREIGPTGRESLAQG